MECSLLGVKRIESVWNNTLLSETHKAEVWEKTDTLKWNWTVYVSRMQSGLLQLLGGCRRTASDDETDEDGDGGIAQMEKRVV